MNAAMSLLSAGALAIALLVPLRDDRRGKRATIGGNAPLRALFPAQDPAPDDDAAPSSVDIALENDAGAGAPVDVLSRSARDASDPPDGASTGEATGEGSAQAERTASTVTAPAAPGFFSFRSLAAALGFHRTADRAEVPHAVTDAAPPSETDPAGAPNSGHDEAFDERREPDPFGAASFGYERTFVEEVERLADASPDDALPHGPDADLAADIGDGMRDESTAKRLSSARDAVVQVPAPVLKREAPEPSTDASRSGTPDAIAFVPDGDAYGESPAEAAEPDISQVRGANVPGAETADSATHDREAPDAIARAPREHAAEASSSPAHAPSPLPVDRMRPPLTRLPLRPKREEISWPLLLSDANGGWSEATRHDFLRRAAERPNEDLEAAICAAVREESAAGRRLALHALARRSPAGSRAIFIEALRRGDDDERALAVDVFGERGDREALVEALSDRLDAIAARAALACFGASTRAELERTLAPLVDRARCEAILGLLAGVLL